TGVIYESRPNVTVDISTLALKAGNAVILRGGSDVINTNLEVVRVLTEALVSAGLPEDTMQYIASTDRRYVGEMLKMHDSIDMIIPRGGSGLHNFCRENSTIPVIIGGMGIVHYYVDESANQEKSLPVIYNAKTQRPAVCNSVDTLLVHESIAHEFLPKVVDDLTRADVVFKADEQTLAIIGENDRVSPVAEGDFDTEWMGLTLNLKVVSDVDDAIDHIRQHTTFHSDGILTEDAEQAAYFLNRVDSAAVFWNASTRFNDGSALGLGAEVAISTQKLHARGPMALEELTTYKWVVTGNYTSRP
ncbi:MAG: glutamate-5-semialdehyde dehydrogenase, partial [Anaerolineae bacterium]|nr:glutamate-5-semialdehyde dehydrogenase [Anaerolineae bacterium]